MFLAALTLTVRVEKNKITFMNQVSAQYGGDEDANKFNPNSDACYDYVYEYNPETGNFVLISKTANGQTYLGCPTGREVFCVEKVCSQGAP